MTAVTARAHTYRSVEVPVPGGNLRVGIWDPVDGAGAGASADASAPPSVLAVHGVTASHLAWQFVVDQLPGVRVIAPDLRGRGQSRSLTGPAGMRAHASDLVNVLDSLGVSSIPVVGHSMGGFVSMVLAHLFPERVRRLVLIDGGLPLDAPAGVSPEALVAAILGSTAARLSKRFETPESYLDFWRAHPAFQGTWSPELENYFRYDLVPEDGTYRPATSLETTTEDTVDLNTGSAFVEAIAALPSFAKPVKFVTVPRGLHNEAPGLYPAEHLARLLDTYPMVSHESFDEFNHYTIVMSESGAASLGPLLRSAATDV